MKKAKLHSFFSNENKKSEHRNIYRKTIQDFSFEWLVMVIDLGPDKIKLKLKKRYEKINIPILAQGFLAISASIFPILL